LAKAHNTSGGATPSPRRPSSSLTQHGDVVAGDVEHGVFDIGKAKRAFPVEQTELADFLMGGEQVAFDMIGNEIERLRRR
jgi:hypothetical protein